jgi:hypothetical protein
LIVPGALQATLSKVLEGKKAILEGGIDLTQIPKGGGEIYARCGQFRSGATAEFGWVNGM